MAEKLTDRTAKTSNFADGDLVHVVDVSDTSQDPAGSSFKSTIGDIYGSYLAPKITSAQIVTNAADTYSVTLADTVSSNHYLYLLTASGDPFVDVTVTSYASPKDGAILVIRLNRAGTDDLTIPGFAAASGFPAGVYTARYSTSSGTWLPVNYASISAVEDFIDLADVPSTYSGQANKIVKVNAAADGLEFGQEVYNLKVPLTAAQIKTANSVPIDIGLPASGVGFYYRVTAFDVNPISGSTPFDVATYLGIFPSTVPFNNVWTASLTLLGSPGTLTVGLQGVGAVFTNSPNYVENDILQIGADADSTVGDYDLDIYIIVVKVAL
jgi:hypothetical protein